MLSWDTDGEYGQFLEKLHIIKTLKMKENLKNTRERLTFLKLTFRKLCKKLKDKMEISERATYNISLQLKSYEDILVDEENCLTRR